MKESTPVDGQKGSILESLFWGIVFSRIQWPTSIVVIKSQLYQVNYSAFRSVGCTVVEMLTGDPPLKYLEPQAAMFRIGSKPLEVKLPKGVSKEARDFVRAALTWLVLMRY